MRNFYLYLPLLLLACQPAKAQIDFSDRSGSLYEFSGREPGERLPMVRALLQDALDPHRHMQDTDKVKKVYLETHGRMPTLTHHGRVYEQVMYYLYELEKEKPVKKNLVRHLQMREYAIDGMRIRIHDVTEPRQGAIIECFDAQNRMVLLYYKNIYMYQMDYWPGLDPDIYDPYFRGDHAVLYVFDYDRQGAIRKLVKYYEESDSWRWDALFEDITAEKLPLPVALPETASWSPMVSAPADSLLNPARLSENQDCDHDHICCDVGCRCCEENTIVQPVRVAIKPGPPAPDFTKTLGDGVWLDVFLGNDEDKVPPRYVFSTKRRAPVMYYSTLSNRGLLAAWEGETAFFEYDENGEAWVMKADRKTFCKINKQGEEVALTVDAELLGTANIANTQLDKNLYAVEWQLHDHLPDITDANNESIKLTGLADNTGRVLPNSILAGTVRGITQHTIVVGEYRGAIAIDDIWEQPQLEYFVCATDFKKLSKPYAEIDTYWGCGLTAVRAAEGGWGFIDTLGREVIPCIYQRAGYFQDGKAQVYKSEAGLNDSYYIDTKGQRLPGK